MSYQVKRWTQWKTNSSYTCKTGEDIGKPLSPRLASQTGEYRKSWLTWAETHKQKLPRKPVLQKTYTIELLEALRGQLWQLKNSGNPVVGRCLHFHVFYLQFNQILTVNREKSPCATSTSRERKPFWNIPGQSVLLKACPQGKLINLSLTGWGIIRV